MLYRSYVLYKGTVWLIGRGMFIFSITILIRYYLQNKTTFMWYNSLAI